MDKLYIVTLKNRDDLNVKAECFTDAALKVATDERYGDEQILKIEFVEEIQEG